MDKIELTEEWQLYQKGIDYNNRINYYNKTDRNWSFYNGDQWRGVVSNGLPTPVFNVLKRIINYFVASIMSRKITGKFMIENIPDAPDNPHEISNTYDDELRKVAEILTSIAEFKWDKDKIDNLLRKALLDAANSGDMCAYVYWDSEIETGQYAKGDFCTELVDGANVLFGNVNSEIVEKQPYILIVGRDSVKNLKAEAKKNGATNAELESINPDQETNYQVGDKGKIELDSQGDLGNCLYILKFWKENNTVWFSKSTRSCKIKKPVDMLIKRYPIAWGNWENVKNSYHGQAVSTGLIPNQIYINKQFAMTMLWLMNMAYGKVVYDSTRISGWDNKIGVAQPIEGDVTGAVQQINPGQMNNVVLNVIDKAIQYTKEMLGANDSALGDINPEMASGTAIMAQQKQASVPLQNVESALYKFVEDILLIWGDFFLSKYNVDRKVSYNKSGKIMTDIFNSQPYKDLLFRVKVDVGPSTYWSEVASMQVLDNLLSSDRITTLQYLERVSNGTIPKIQELIEEKKQELEQQTVKQQPQVVSQDESKLHEAMAQFMEQLPSDVQQQLQSMPPDKMEETILDMMNGGDNNG